MVTEDTKMSLLGDKHIEIPKINFDSPQVQARIQEVLDIQKKILERKNVGQ